MTAPHLTLDDVERLSRPRNARMTEGKPTKLPDGRIATPIVIKRPGFRDVRGVVVHSPEGE